MNEIIINTRQFTQFYQTDIAKVFCTVTLFQRVGQDPNIIIFTPDSLLSPSLYNLDSLSTGYMIQICNIKNATYIDYINAIALCMLNHELKFDILVATKIENDLMVYSPLDSTIKLFFINEKFSKDKFDHLKQHCLQIYESLLKMIEK